MDNEEFESLKKDAELKKLNKEIVKLDAESKELSWRKFSAWAPAISSIIIGFITLYFTISSGFLDGKSALVKAEALVMQVRKDSLSRTIDSLKSIYRKDSINFLTRIKNQDKQLDSLSQKFIQDKIKFDKERVKSNQVILQNRNQIRELNSRKDSLIKNKDKLIDCFSRANDFIMTYCIKVDEIPYQEIFSPTPKPFYHRFSKPFEEIAKMDISSLNYQQFLIEFADYKVSSNEIIDKFLISNDNKKKIELSVIQGHYNQKLISDLHIKLTGQFNCWKRLSKEERLQLLNQSINRNR